MLHIVSSLGSPALPSTLYPLPIPVAGTSQDSLLTLQARYLDMPRLISWLSSRQYAPEGGLSGRTNKLVDGCYSHWVGGCWPLIEAAIHGPTKTTSTETPSSAVGDLYSREGLVRYILCCGQDQTKRGGMRDKPYQ